MTTTLEPRATSTDPGGSPAPQRPRPGREAVLEQLAADGITYLFGNPGTVEQGLLDAVEDHPELTYVLGLQEAVVVGIADGYARATHEPTLVQLHSGVGLGNGVGMLYQALRGHAPLVVVAGESGVAFEAMDAQMACDLVAMAEPVTKWATRATHPESLLRTLRRAVKIATTPPMGPVFVSLPMDVLDAPTSEPVVPSVRPRTRVVPGPEDLRQAAGLLTGGQRPLLLLGDGVAFSQAQAEVVQAAEALGAEVYLVDSSEPNFPADHPLYRGHLGHMFGHVSTAAVQDADRVLVVGTYLFPEVFPSLTSPFAPGCRIVHVDLDGYEIAKNHPVDLGLVADPRDTLRALLPLLREHAPAPVPTPPPAPAADQGSVLDAFLVELTRAVPAEELLVFDEALTASPVVQRHLPAVRPGSQFLTRGGSLGVGVPGAIGLKLAHPDRRVLALTGDGGSMYTFQAIWTAARLGLDLLVVVCNNHRYELLNLNIDEYWHERGDVEVRHHPSPFALGDPDIDFVALAQSLGGSGIRCTTRDDAAAAVAAALGASGPFVIDLSTDDLVPPAPARAQST